MITVKGLGIIALLVSGTSLALAQNGPATGGEYPVAGGAAGGWYPGYGYGYGYGAAAPLYDYAAPGYGYAAPAYAAPATAGTTIIIVTPAPAYASRPMVSGYYAAPSTVVSQPLYAYAPGYGYGYTPGYRNRGYWGRYGYGWR